MQKKTLGGARLGSGNKMQVELHGYERSTHDLSYLWRSTMSAGTLVPFLCEVALPGDTFDIDLEAMIMTHPTIGPLFGSYKVQLDTFQAPIRLYQGSLHNNKLGIGLNMASIKLPIIRLGAPEILDRTIDLDNAQVNPSCLLSYLGIRGVGIMNGAADPHTRDFNAIPLLAYWDIYKNYYANKQEEIGAVIHTPKADNVLTITGVSYLDLNGGLSPISPSNVNVPLQPGGTLYIYFSGSQPKPEELMIHDNVGNKVQAAILAYGWSLYATGVLAGTVKGSYPGFIATGRSYIDNKVPFQTTPKVKTFPLSDIDTMREKILQAAGSATAFRVDNQNLEPYKLVCGTSNGYYNKMNTQEGLGVKTYLSDLFNNWLQTDWIDGVGGINDITAIDTSGGSFNIDTLQLSKKVYDMLNRIAVSGGSYDDWLDAVYDHDRFTRAESPIYHGGLIRELVFQEVISNSGTASDGSTQPLGTLAGRGVMGSNRKGGKISIRIDEPSYIIGIVSLTPRLDYSQGNKWDVTLATIDDLHKPALDEIGFQELVTEQMAWWDTYEGFGGIWTQRSAGKQPAWLNYMTNVNRVLGNFAIRDNEMFMTLNRRYEVTPTGTALQIKDLTTYIDPVKYNYIFAETSLDAQNFWTQISVDMIVRRKMSAKVMPNL